MIEDFVTFWRRLEAASPYVHPDDLEALTPRDKALMQFSLLPLPINGNLHEAEIVILMLNPGFSEGDLTWGSQAQRASMAQSLLANIRQAGWPDRYAMFDLNPSFVGSGGADYWVGNELDRPGGKFGHLVSALADGCSISKSEARRFVAFKIAVLQLVAYRATSFRDLQNGQQRYGPPQSRLASSGIARRLADFLIEEKQRLVVVPYGIQHWGFFSAESNSHLEVYRYGLREAHFAPSSPGFAPMLRRLTKSYFAGT